MAPGVNVAAVVVVGDVPAPVSGPGVEHHDVVLGPPDEEAAGLDQRTGVLTTKQAACSHNRPSQLSSVVTNNKHSKNQCCGSGSEKIE